MGVHEKKLKRLQKQAAKLDEFFDAHEHAGLALASVAALDTRDVRSNGILCDELERYQELHSGLVNLLEIHLKMAEGIQEIIDVLGTIPVIPMEGGFLKKPMPLRKVFEGAHCECSEDEDD